MRAVSSKNKTKERRKSLHLVNVCSFVCLFVCMFVLMALTPSTLSYLIHVKNIPIYVISRVLPGRNFKAGDCSQHFQPNLVITAVLIGTVDIYHSKIFSDFYLGLGSQGQRKTKPVGLIFTRTFQLTRMKFDMVLRKLTINIFSSI